MNHEQQDDLAQGPEEGGAYSGHYLSITGTKHPHPGKIVERTTADDPKAVKRTPKPNDDGTPRPDVYERIYDSFSGHIEALHHRERTVPWQNEPLKSTVVVLSAGGETYNLELSHGDRYWPAFVNALASGKVDFSRGVRIAAWNYKSKKPPFKQIIGLGIYQKATPEQVAAGATVLEDGTVQIPWRWTKENPGKLPQGYQVKDGRGQPILKNGNPIWDFSERDEFLRSVVEHFAQKLRDMHDATMSEAEKGAAPAPTPVASQVQAQAPVAKAAPAYDPDDDTPAPFTEPGAPGSEDSPEDDLQF